MKKKPTKDNKKFHAFQKHKKQLAYPEAMKDEILALILDTMEDEEVIQVFQYGVGICLFEVKKPDGKIVYVVPSKFMYAYIEHFSDAEETLYEFLQDGDMS